MIKYRICCCSLPDINPNACETCLAHERPDYEQTNTTTQTQFFFPIRIPSPFAAPKEAIKPFNNKDRHCEKCGGQLVPDYGSESYVKHIPANHAVPEHLEKKCQHCGYVWREFVKDKEIKGK